MKRERHCQSTLCLLPIAGTSMTWAYDATQTRFDNINLPRPRTNHSSLIRCSLKEHTDHRYPRKNAWIQALETLHYYGDSTASKSTLYILFKFVFRTS